MHLFDLSSNKSPVGFSRVLHWVMKGTYDAEVIGVNDDVRRTRDFN